MAIDFQTHLDNIDFEKYLDRLKKKIGNSKVIIYGSGSFFQYIIEKYDLSNLNILGVSDIKFLEEQEGETCSGYKIIPKNKIKLYNPDYVLVATLEYTGIVENFRLNIFNNSHTKIYPLARMSFWDFIKEIWRK